MRYGFVIFLLMLGIPRVQAETLEQRAARDVIVKWRTATTALDAAELLLQHAPVIAEVKPALPDAARSPSGLDRIHVVTLASSDNLDNVLCALRDDPNVEYAEPRPLRYTDEIRKTGSRERGALDGVPDDPFYNMQWGFEQIEAPSAWNITRGDPSVIIAVVDIGVWFDHPELSGLSWSNTVELTGSPGVDDDANGFIDDFHGYDFVDMDGNPAPFPLELGQSHGTHISGVAAGIRNNGQGIAGLAPDCRILSVRAGSGGSIPYGYEGIYYACIAGAKIINCSWGGESESAYEHDILEFAAAHGSIVVASAGNDGNGLNLPHYPSAVEGVVSVAASGVGDHAALFTQHGPWVKVSAPGVAIISTVIGAGGIPSYDLWEGGLWQGTSMAAPFVSATLALVASHFPQMSRDAIIQRVISSSDPIDDVNPNRAGLLGVGRINAWRALADSVAGLRLGQWSLTEMFGNGDGRIRAGETAALDISVYNDLTPLDNVLGTISTSEDSILITFPASVYNDLSIGGPFWNSSPSFRIELPFESERARILPLTVDWIDANQRLLGRATTRVYLDSTFVALNNGRLSLGFAEHGSLGYQDYERGSYIGPGLRIEDRPSNALYHGSFLLAADGMVSDNGFGNAELNRFDWVTVPDSVAHMVPSDLANLEARATFEDSQAEQMLFARVKAAALGWTSINEDGFLILEYEVINRSVNPWNEAYVGFYFDWDLGAASRNLSHFDTTNQIAYVSQVVSGHPLIGVVPLNRAWSAYYVVDNRNEIDPPADWSDARKWQILTGGINPSPTTPMDLSHMLAVGSFTVDAHDSMTVAFALVTGHDLPELRANALAADAHYVSRKTVLPPPPVVKLTPGLYPNPLSQGENLRLVLPDTGPAMVRFYNVLGRQLAEITVPISHSGSANVDLSALQDASGVLFYSIEAAGDRFSGKLLRLR